MGSSRRDAQSRHSDQPNTEALSGLIFLAYAEHRFEQIRPELEAKATARRPVTADIKAKSVLYVPDEARLSNLAALPEATDLGAAADRCEPSKNTTPSSKTSCRRPPETEKSRRCSDVRSAPRTLSGDAFGLIYEDFLSNFAAAEGKRWWRILHALLDRPSHR